jgi:hypothetical protein
MMEMKYCIAILLALSSFSTYAVTYKWVDAEGKLHITDTPPPPSVKAEKVRTPHTTGGIPAASAPAPAPTIYERAADLNKEKQAREEAAKKAADEKALADAKQNNCEAARTQLSSLQNAPRIATYDDKGERSFMDDDARQRKIQEAQDAVSKSCN